MKDKSMELNLSEPVTLILSDFMPTLTTMVTASVDLESLGEYLFKSVFEILLMKEIIMKLRSFLLAFYAWTEFTSN